MNLVEEFFTGVPKLLSNPQLLLLFVKGCFVTVLISVAAGTLGLIIGTFVAMIMISEKNKLTAIPKLLCRIYITVIRGTPMMLQLCIMVMCIITIEGFPTIITAMLAFGINSGAYVAENIRAGILSIDQGQTEAGRALGLSGRTTMYKIVIPQAIKNVIPAIGNELIALIKETSIVGCVGSITDLTRAAEIAQSGQHLSSYFVPALLAAIFYLGIVYLLTFIIKMIEKRLRASDKR